MNKKKDSNQLNRRGFIGKLAPACILSGIGVSALASGTGKLSQLFDDEEEDRFKQEVCVPGDRLFMGQYTHFIRFMKKFKEEMGDEKLLSMLRKANDELRIAMREKRKGDGSFESFKRPFVDGGFDNMSTTKVIRNTEHVLEVKITRCLIADIYRRKKAADIGYAAHCHGDFAGPPAHNPKMKLYRTKTLMEGHDCCNHCYKLEG